MSPKEPPPILLASLYFLPTRSSMLRASGGAVLAPDKLLFLAYSLPRFLSSRKTTNLEGFRPGVPIRSWAKTITERRDAFLSMASWGIIQCLQAFQTKMWRKLPWFTLVISVLYAKSWRPWNDHRHRHLAALRTDQRQTGCGSRRLFGTIQEPLSCDSPEISTSISLSYPIKYRSIQEGGVRQNWGGSTRHDHYFLMDAIRNRLDPQ